MSLPEQEAAYTEFSEQIFAVYTGGGSPRHLHFTLAFAEAELCAVSQYAGGRASPCVEKALSLVRHLLDGVKTKCRHYPPSPSKTKRKTTLLPMPCSCGGRATSPTSWRWCTAWTR